MTKKKNKQRLEDSLSEAINPKPKTDRLGSVHSLLGNYRSEPVEKTKDEETQPIPTHTTQPTHPNPSQPIQPSPVSPQRDFTKVPNSVTKAIPDGVFPGQSKNTYDVLLQKTRGHIVPRRTIQLTKQELMILTRLSRNTVFKHIKQLESVGYVKKVPVEGSHEGYIYEVFTPEEATHPNPSQPIPANPTHTTQKVADHPYQKEVLDGMGKPAENKEVKDENKTLFKTKNKTDDDSRLAFIVEKLNEGARKVTGKDATEKDLKALAVLLDILNDETILAATRTHSVSAYVPFMTENLWRRLHSKSRKESKLKKDTVGRASETFTVTPRLEGQEDFVVEPLSEDGRQNVLEALRVQQAKGNSEFINSLMGTYTLEDWNWLMEQLEGK